MHHCFRLFKLF